MNAVRRPVAGVGRVSLSEPPRVPRRSPVNAAVVALLALTAGACRGKPEASSASAGRVLYEENGCATCHGPAGRGDGRIAVTLNPRPRDFRDAAAFKKGTDELAIAATLVDGFGADGGQMPRFVHLTDWERRSLALFVISLRTPPTSAEGSGQP